jgi:thiamine pyrophosphate-dependent acetolactate synthase large subunit-like protein
VFVNLDATIQEEPSHGVPMPPLDRFPAAVTGDPPADAVAAVAAMLAKARRPLLMIGRVSSDPGDFHRRVQLAERLDARVLTDLKTGASFPTKHRLHPHAPGLYVSSEAGILIREADVIVSLDWVDLAGSLRQACGGETPTAKIVQCSVDQYSHHGWNMDYQSLPQTDVTILSSPDRLVSCLLATIEERAPRPSIAPPAPALSPSPVATADAAPSTEHLSIDALARTTVDALAAHRPVGIRLPLGWPGNIAARASAGLIGFDGGGGIGSGPGMASAQRWRCVAATARRSRSSATATT